MYLLLDSRDRTNIVDSTTNFTINLSNTIKSVTAVKLKQTGFNHKIYNVSLEYNNSVFQFQEMIMGTVTRPISILLPDGHYTAEQLAVTLENLMNANSQYIYAITYSKNTFKFTISSTVSFYIWVNELSIYMGFTVTANDQLIQTGDSICKIDDVKCMFMDISCLPKPITCSNDVKSTFIIPNIELASEYSGLPNQVINITSTDIQHFTVFLKNRDGSQVDLHQSEFWILLELLQS